MNHCERDRDHRRFARDPAHDDARDRHPEGGPHRHARHHGGHGRLVRVLEYGDLRLLALHLVAERPRHGYNVMKAIREMANGTYTPSSGVVYPALVLLEEMGLVTVSQTGSLRKLYTVTAEGSAHLAANASELAAIMAHTARIGSGLAPPQIVRAMENLKLSLRLRLSRGGLDDARLCAIAAALDAAAAVVEQS